MHENTISISIGNNVSSALLQFDFATEYLSQPEKYEYERDVYLSIPTSKINFIIDNFHDVDLLNIKFDELREKEINNNITEFEKILLYDVLEKRILEFPNPYLPSDHEKGMEIIRRYNLIEGKESRRNHKNGFRKKSWFNLFSWPS